MKNRITLLSLLFAAASVLNAGPSGDLVIARNGALMFPKDGAVVLTDSFQKPGKVWKEISNFEDHLKFTYTGGGLVMINRRGVERDTAWGFTSHPFRCPDGADAYTLVIRLRSSMDTLKASGGPAYSNIILWFDQNGNKIGADGSKFKYDSRSDLTHSVTVSGIVPKNAAAGVLHLGADSPNITPGAYLKLSGVRLSLYRTLRASYAVKGNYISDPVPVSSGNLTWTADMPDGCSLAFQVAAVQPGKDPVFMGPDGKPDTFFRKEAPLPTFPDGTKKMLVKAVLTGNGSNTPLLKEIRAGKTVLRDFRFRGKSADTNTITVTQLSLSPNADLKAPLRFRVLDESEPDWNSMKVILDKENITKKLVRERTILTYTPPSGSFTEGLHEYTVTLIDRAGREQKFLRTFYRGKMDIPVSRRVTLRDDGMVLVGGKPFFPIGIYAVAPREFNGKDIDKAFKDLKEAGFNFAHTYKNINDAYGDQFVAAAEKYGFRLFISTCGRYSNVAKWAKSPAILAWYTGDDTASHQTPLELKTSDVNIKAIDPYKLTCQADGIGGLTSSRYRAYVDGTDAFLPEIYPVQRDNEETKQRCVPQVLADMQVFYNDLKVVNAGRTGNGRPVITKSCWAIIQHFKGWGWDRFPTERELRAMSYAAIAAGAHGITWYTYGGYHNKKTGKTNYGITSSPQVWKEITTITKELNRLHDVLASRTVPCPGLFHTAGPRKDALGFNSVTAIAKEHQGTVYVIAVNSTLADVRVGMKTGRKTVTDWFTGKTVPGSGGATPLQFKPYEVKILTFKK